MRQMISTGSGNFSHRVPVVWLGAAFFVDSHRHRILEWKLDITVWEERWSKIGSKKIKSLGHLDQ